ncbi:MAG: hypothetical protein RIR87_1147, partial [Actinomycetota bacterium]
MFGTASGRIALAVATTALALVALVACGAQPVGAPAPVAGDPLNESGSSEDVSTISLLEVATLDQPVDAASRTGDDAVYFVSRTGTIHRLVNGVFESTAVLDISDLTEGEGEQGLLGLAFSNDGATAFVNYTDTSGDTTIASLSVDAG